MIRQLVGLGRAWEGGRARGRGPGMCCWPSGRLLAEVLEDLCGRRVAGLLQTTVLRHCCCVAQIVLHSTCDHAMIHQSQILHS